MRNGAGTYNLPQAPFTPGTVISSTAVNSNFSDIANALTQSLANDGQTVPTANLPMGTYRHTGVGNAVARSDYAATGQVQDNAFAWCGTAGGTANALTLTPSPAITAYAAGQVFIFTAGASPNTGATTVAVSGLTAQAIQNAGAALTGGEIAALRQYQILYNGTAFQLQPFASSTPGAGSITTAMLQDNAVTNAKLADMAANTVKVRAAATTGGPSDLALSASQLLGRGSTGDVAAIALGTGLSMSGATLSATVSAGVTGYAEYTTNADITTVIPYDDTIPQSTEGVQILSVTINVPSATAEVFVFAQGTTSRTSGTSTGITALFNGGANAIAASINYIDAINAPAGCWNIVHRYVPGASGNVTFTVRTGPDTGTIRLNGTTSARFLGGVAKATLYVTAREP